MAFVKRMFFFFLTNILILITLSLVLNIVAPYFGIDPKSYMGMLVLYSILFGFGGAFISLLLSKWMAKMMMGVKVIDPRTSDPNLRWIVEKVHAYSRAAGIRQAPEVGIYESPDPNAFATGPTKNSSLVAVSTGLLRHMNQDEVEGVLGHEVAHIANGDMVTMTLIQGVINAMVIFFARILASIVAGQIRDENGSTFLRFGLIMLFEILFSFLGMFVVAWFSRHREFRADKGGARLAGRDSMIRGLRKLQSMYHPEYFRRDESFATMKISGRRGGGLMALLSTHPPLEQRIQALERASIL